ncbi:hypothetical protein, partial [Burkholderia ubonensis]|uniref:hypothetical protein n=1 Tax=Burkholderia ubonensis TaxID=101571 RepID=UPI001E3025D6
ALIRCATSTRAGSALRVRAIDSVRSGDEIELSQRNFYLNSIGPRPIPASAALPGTHINIWRRR